MKVSRHSTSDLLNRLSLLIILCFLSAFSCLFADPLEKKQRTVPFKILYNHDGTNMLSCLSPWCPEDINVHDVNFIEKALIGSIEELAGIGIDAVAFNPGNGSIPWWQSKVYPDHWKWYVKRTGKTPSPYGRYVMAGGDLVKVFVETCRKLGLAPVITLRLKDEHCITKMDSEWVTKFFYEHQQWRLDSRPNAVFGLRGLNWIFPEVRNERLRIIEELAQNYDIDGFELDFMRFPPFFKVDQTGYAQRRDIMTGFIRTVREILNRTAKPGQKRYLSIRVPNRYKEYKALGIDLALLDKENLVDIINVSPSFVSQVESDISLLRAWAPGSCFFYEMTQCCSRGSSPSWGLYGDDYPVRLTTEQKFYTMANLAWARGADGISLFNFPYYRPGRRKGKYSNQDYLPHEPPFHVIEKLSNPKWLNKQSQHYWIPAWWKTGYHGRQFQLPKTFVVGTEHTLELDIQLPVGGIAKALLRIQNAEGTPGLKWKAWIDDNELALSNKINEPLDDPYKGWLGKPAQYTAWHCPPQVLHNGRNFIKIKLVDGPVSDLFKTDIIFIDLAVFCD